MSAQIPKRILCPVDFSNHSAAALRAAGSLAKLSEAEVTVLHARRLDTPVYFTASQISSLRAQLKQSERAARRYITRFADQHLPETVRRSIVLKEEEPVMAILDTVRDTSPDLIVLGTHGRTGLEKIRLGSVAESVLAHAPGPVLTIGPHAVTKILHNLGPIQRILCPVDTSAGASDLAQYAAMLAEIYKAQLTLIRVLEPKAAADFEIAQKAQDELCDWVDKQVRGRCSARHVIRSGHAAQQIIDLAETSKANLIVLGRSARDFLGALFFGKTTEEVIRGAPCPVLSLPIPHA